MAGNGHEISAKQHETGWDWFSRIGLWKYFYLFIMFHVGYM